MNFKSHRKAKNLNNKRQNPVINQFYFSVFCLSLSLYIYIYIFSVCCLDKFLSTNGLFITLALIAVDETQHSSSKYRINKSGWSDIDDDMTGTKMNAQEKKQKKIIKISETSS
jgi:hypothetical protein